MFSMAPVNHIAKKIATYFRRQENASLSERFISGIELVYSLILACAVVKVLEIIHGDVFAVLRSTWPAMIVSGLFLLRFFFAPSQNLRVLGEHARGWKWTILPFDGLALFALSFLFYFMCLNIEDPELFYRLFFYALFFDVIWLLTIICRCRTDKFLHNRIWIYNNLAFVFLYIVLPASWQVWFVLAVANSLIDFGATYSEYFKS